MAASAQGRGDDRRRDVAELRASLAEAAAEGSDGDTPVFVPHLELLDLASALSEGVGARDVDPDFYGEVLETICGATDDSQPVEQYNGNLGVTRAFVAANQRPVAQVQWNDNLAARYTNSGNVSGLRWGTGTMISRDLFLTAGHLFDQTGGGWNRPLQNGTTNVISSQEIARNMHLNFHFQVDPAGTARPERRFPILELLEFRLGGVDYAICRIFGNPGYAFGWTDVATADAAVDDMLCIIGHPAGVPKRIEAGPALSLSGNAIRYNDIDTLGGNSGSGILHSPSERLVGVHTNGGCNAAGTGSNSGMRISSIRAQSPIMRNFRSQRRSVLAVDSWGPNRLDIFGLGTDEQMFHKAWDGSKWATGWEALGGIFHSAPAVASWGTDRLDIFGLGTNYTMFHKAWDGSAWRPSVTGWEALGGVFNSPPAVVSWGPDRLDIFGLGQDNQMFHKAWDGSAWRPSVTGWEALGGVFNSPPAVVSWGPDRLDIFGLGQDNQMFHKAWDGSKWGTGWEALGGVFNSPPAVVSWGPNRLDIFGLGQDNQMFHKAWDGSKWGTGWEALGGVFNSAPAVSAWGPNRLDIFGLGQDNQMFHKAWDGSAWRPSVTGWEALGGVFNSAPAVSAWAPNRLDTFGLGQDNQMFHKAWDGSEWGTGWEALGGVFNRP